MRKQRDAAGDQTSPAENVRVLKRYFGRFRIYCYHGMDFTSQELNKVIPFRLILNGVKCGLRIPGIYLFPSIKGKRPVEYRSPMPRIQVQSLIPAGHRVLEFAEIEIAEGPVIEVICGHGCRGRRRPVIFFPDQFGIKRQQHAFHRAKIREPVIRIRLQTLCQQLL